MDIDFDFTFNIVVNINGNILSLLQLTVSSMD